MDITLWAWIGFHAIVFLVLALDLGVFHRRSHKVSIREAGLWTLVWVTLSLIFNGIIWLWRGPEDGLNFLTGYLVEYSLSVDNIFVFILLFSYFRVPAQYQHRVLFWGILGALIMRGTMILLGSALIEQFEWILYLFGAFLLVTGVRLIFHDDEPEVDPQRNLLVRLARRLLPITPDMRGDRFFVREADRFSATPLFLVLLIVESTDLLFAVDSIPAIFGITHDPFIVYTSNICAILGLRSLYFLLAGVMESFYYLRFGLAIILSFIGVKMLTPLVTGWFLGGHSVHIPTTISLGVIVVTLLASVVASLIRSRRLASATD
ncbi:MAG: membrane protein [Chloroflexus sp.]|uniref:Integral membrane protein TerC n=1 Tax=Chloroflexus aurantiacus (strain ATCC 29366 / DSM 635 / J-10-fl) TaxID=324602 RepID=A9WCV3_CHLAA|nr:MULTISPECIES: TerC family protein [Chloroflexus]ABY33522.1 Integral membrane protein TerC [Chloroflexus aurantiacus J-10-fl]RMG49888.1 MAG: TerC family protein [Chloroflexota bacterium]GIV86974.1 MAG: membrane protein [Chloroflexus sp.]HBW65982.1 TerC family protein [Chloroflexus aurantiacus]